LVPSYLCDEAEFIQRTNASLEFLKPRIGWANKLLDAEYVSKRKARDEASAQSGEYFAWRLYPLASEAISIAPIALQNTLIGEIDLHTWDWSVPKCEVGYWLTEDAVGFGFATEAVAAVCIKAFELAQVQRIQGMCDFDNASSVKLLERLGFQREGRLRNYERNSVNNALCDQLLFSMIPSEQHALKAFDRS
jgi:RimJ/RimL family protein N-acetyltransferase